jgi:hypothetical protein
MSKIFKYKAQKGKQRKLNEQIEKVNASKKIKYVGDFHLRTFIKNGFSSKKKGLKAFKKYKIDDGNGTKSMIEMMVELNNAKKFKTVGDFKDVTFTNNGFLSKQEGLNDFENYNINDGNGTKSMKKMMGELKLAKARNTLNKFSKIVKKNIRLVLDGDSTELDISNAFLKVLKKVITKNKQYDIATTTYTFHRDLLITSNTKVDIITALINRLLDEVKTEQNLQDNDRIRYFINAGNSDGIPFYWSTKFLASKMITAEEISKQLAAMLNSGAKLAIKHSEMGFTTIKQPAGKGTTLKAVNMTEFNRKKGYKVIENDDDHCFVYALFIAIKNLELTKDILDRTKYKNFLRLSNKTKKTALLLYQEADMDAIGNIGLEDIGAFESALKITINIFDLKSGKPLCIYPHNLTEQYEDQVYLHLHNNHYNTILSINSFYNGNEKAVYDFCKACKKFVKKAHHKCEVKSLLSICNKCLKTHSHDTTLVYCNDCNRNFHGQECYDIHKENDVCSTVKVCKRCKALTKKHKNCKYFSHTCFHRYCKKCDKNVPLDGHECYIQKLRAGIDIKPEHKRIIFYDYECYTNTEGKHIPNLIVVQKMMSSEPTDYIQFVFYNNDDFCKWLFTNENIGAACIAHYSKGYDIHLIKEYLYNADIPINFSSIDAGNKTLLLSVPKLKMKFIDSISFIAAPLAKFPKIFEIKEMMKGYFPHAFNKPYTQDYVGPYPDKAYYFYGGMKPDDQIKFDKWYYSKYKEVFDFKHEFLQYCISDVSLLRVGWLKFKTLFMELIRDSDAYKKMVKDAPDRLGILPFQNNISKLSYYCVPDPTNYTTIASYVYAVYRYIFMPKNSMGIIDETNINFSVGELEWLTYLEQVKNVGQINKQHKIGNYSVDGYCEITNTVYEYNGCYFHGCKFCYDRNIMNHTKQKNMDMLLIEWMKKKSKLIELGYNVVEMWEHKWKKERMKYKDFIEDNKERFRAPHKSMRDAFFGGRTEVFDMYAKSDEETEIGYADFTSLYPSVQCLSKFMVGHPERITCNYKDLSEYFGFVYCKVKPNSDMRIPILPNRSNGKLQFENKIVTGIWGTEELKMAVEYGYEILEIYEVIHFKETSNNLFQDYIKTFYKVKCENAVEIPTAEQILNMPEYANLNKEDLTDEIFELEYERKKQRVYDENLNGAVSVLLDISKMCSNPGLKFIAKLCLNSLWGKFGQAENKIQKVIIKNDPAKFYNIVFDDSKEISNINFLNEATIEMSYRNAENFSRCSQTNNVALCAFVTQYARMWLYKEMDHVGFDNVLYCDTDSLIYYYRKGNNPIITDDRLGGLTDELDGCHIKEIACLAPKTYAYIKSNGNVVVKAKGFRLSGDACKQINYKNMKNMVHTSYDEKDQSKAPTHTVAFNQITLNGKTKRLISNDTQKIFKVGYTKRSLDFDSSTKTRMTTQAF